MPERKSRFSKKICIKTRELLIRKKQGTAKIFAAPKDATENLRSNFWLFYHT